MKKILLVTASMIALSATAASAADLAARPYTKAPPPIVSAVYDWTGFYIGINGGWGQSHDNRSVDGIGSAGSYDANGGTVGGQVGYRWQAGGWVFGLEAVVEELLEQAVTVEDSVTSNRQFQGGAGIEEAGGQTT